jgi:hypothetical protein
LEKIIKSNTIENLIRMIRELMENRFYGELVIKFEAGKITICRKTENIKI